MTEETPGSESAGPAESGPGEERAGHSQPQNPCPECEKPTIRGSDTCQYCGAPLESELDISIEIWEWGGGLIAAFGIFLTPLLPGPIALYCAYRVHEYKPKAARWILLVVLGTVIFWIVLPLLILP